MQGGIGLFCCVRGAAGVGPSIDGLMMGKCNRNSTTTAGGHRPIIQSTNRTTRTHLPDDNLLVQHDVDPVGSRRRLIGLCCVVCVFARGLMSWPSAMSRSA